MRLERKKGKFWFDGVVAAAVKPGAQFIHEFIGRQWVMVGVSKVLGRISECSFDSGSDKAYYPSV